MKGDYQVLWAGFPTEGTVASERQGLTKGEAREVG